MSNAETPTYKGAGASSAQRPLFYRRPEPLSSERHRELGIGADANYSFTASADAVPLTAAEFVAAASIYPIVFAPGNPPIPVAILGITRNQNLFVSDGKWDSNAYIPAYVRRYPFVMMESADKSQLTVCIDVDADIVTSNSGRKLFSDGEPSEITKQAINFCNSFQKQITFTRRFSAAVNDHQLLVQKQANIGLPGGRKKSVSSFLMVDESKLNALSDKIFLEFRRFGYLPLIYFHLFSLGNFGVLGAKSAG